jgi:hypothetical protein
MRRGRSCSSRSSLCVRSACLLALACKPAYVGRDVRTSSHRSAASVAAGARCLAQADASRRALRETLGSLAEDGSVVVWEVAAEGLSGRTGQAF